MTLPAIGENRSDLAVLGHITSASGEFAGTVCELLCQLDLNILDISYRWAFYVSVRRYDRRRAAMSRASKAYGLGRETMIVAKSGCAGFSR
jgi:hypothetical protein